MEIRDRQLDPETAIVALRGRLDTSSAQALDEKLIEVTAAGARFAIIDLAGLDYVSSAGLRVLLTNGKRLATLRGRLVLHSTQHSVREVLDLSGFSSLFPVVASREEAVAVVAQSR
jgi:anti-anti-sigma factor